MRTIQAQSYIRKSTITNDKSIGGSKQSRIEASSQSKSALLKAAASDSYYARILDLNDM